MRYAVYFLFALIISTLPKIVQAHELNYSSKDLDCITKIVYNEAGNQSTTGKQAVAFVVVNRVKSKSFPNSICAVTNQRFKGHCQFSCGRSRNIPVNKYLECRKAALDVLESKVSDMTHGAVFYHTNYLNPRWRNVIKTASFGPHIFYKEKDG